LGDEWIFWTDGSLATVAQSTIDLLITIPNKHKACSLGEREAG